MNHLKKQNVAKCFSLLKEFIHDSQGENNKRGVALLALDHLQKITAGTDDPNVSSGTTSSGESVAECLDKPRAFPSPEGGN